MSYKKRPPRRSRVPRRSRKRKTKKQTRTHRRLQKGAAAAVPAEGGAAPADVKWNGKLKLESLLRQNYASRADFRNLDDIAKVAYEGSESEIDALEARASVEMTDEAEKELAQDIKDAIINIALVEYKLQTNQGFLGYIQNRLQGIATGEAQQTYDDIMGPD